MEHPVRVWSQERGVKLQWLAGRIGVSPSMLTHYLTGRKVPTQERMERIAVLTGISMDSLRDWHRHPEGE